MPFCTKCGDQLKDSDLFCSQCGAAVTGTNRENPPKDMTDVVQESAVSENKSPVLEPKGVGIRFLAQIFDAFPILFFYFFAGNMIAASVGGKTPDGFQLEGGPALALMLMTMIFSILYFTLLEAWWNGQSLGKKLLRIKVVNEDGSSINLSTSFLRNALRVVDAFFGYLVGAIFIWRSPKKQRLGDRLAGTIVVKKVKAAKKGRKKTKLAFGEKNAPIIVDTFD